MTDVMIDRRVRLRRGDVVVLGAILNGEDHLASIHDVPGESDGELVVVSVMTTSSRAAELDELIADLTPVLSLSAA